MEDVAARRRAKAREEAADGAFAVVDGVVDVEVEGSVTEVVGRKGLCASFQFLPLTRTMMFD
jgi:hypothetical protein